MTDELRAYHFDLGDSTDGPIGLCSTVLAHNRDEALGILKGRIEEFDHELTLAIDDPQIDYIAIYFNPDAITRQDIDLDWPVDEANSLEILKPPVRQRVDPHEYDFEVRARVKIRALSLGAALRAIETLLNPIARGEILVQPWPANQDGVSKDDGTNPQ